MASVAFMAVSSAESRIPEVPSAPALRPVSGSIKAGYSTNYEFRGLIPAGCNPTAPLRLDWRSDLNDRYSLILALKEESRKKPCTKKPTAELKKYELVA